DRPGARPLTGPVSAELRTGGQNPSPRPPPRSGEGEEERFFTPSPLRGGGRGEGCCPVVLTQRTQGPPHANILGATVVWGQWEMPARQPLPPAPSPKRRGGEGKGCLSFPPLRFGEGAGGRGSRTVPQRRVRKSAAFAAASISRMSS